jgi:hypothetical protein
MLGIAIAGLLGVSLGVGKPLAISLRDAMLSSATVRLELAALSAEIPQLHLGETLAVDSARGSVFAAHQEPGAIGSFTAGAIPLGGLLFSVGTATLRSIASPDADTRPSPLGASIAGAATDAAGRDYLGKLAHNSNLGLNISLPFGLCKHM